MNRHFTTNVELLISFARMAGAFGGYAPAALNLEDIPSDEEGVKAWVAAANAAAAARSDAEGSTSGMCFIRVDEGWRSGYDGHPLTEEEAAKIGYMAFWDTFLCYGGGRTEAIAHLRRGKEGGWLSVGLSERVRINEVNPEDLREVATSVERRWAAVDAG